MGWLISKKLKNHQRKMNRCVRQLNKNIKNDSLWRGRFYLRQIGTPIFNEYSDGSGADLYVRFKLCDTLTGKIATTGYRSVNSWCFLGGVRLFGIMNRFIIEVVDGVSCYSSEPIYYEEPN